MIGTIECSSGNASTLSFGCPALDRHLSGGLALSALHDIAGSSGSVEASGLPALFIAGLLARTTGPVVWVHTGSDLFSPALRQAGLCPSRLIHVETWKPRHVLGAMEEALRIEGLTAVVGEVREADMIATRRLVLASMKARTPAFLIRYPSRRGGDPLGTTSAAATRWRIAPCPGARPAVPGLGRAQWRIELVRARTCAPASWTLLAPDEDGFMHDVGPADRRDRPAVPDDGPPALSAERAVFG